jgi:microcystin-dependent protein
MSAMDFPSNPVDGQTFSNYIWSASTGAWKSKPSVSTVTIHSDVVPATANPGDVWFNTSNGISFTYFNDGTSKQWVEMLSSAVPAVNTIMPAGTIVQTARATAPNLWLFCDGSAVSRTTYQSLYLAIGTTYGSGDGSTTFNLPNLQGKVPVGKNSGTFSALGATGGAETHTLSVTEMPSHTHIQDQHRHQVATNNAAEATSIGGYSPATMTMFFGTDRSASIAYHATAMVNTTATNQNTGGGGAHNNLQPYIVLNYMIKV